MYVDGAKPAKGAKAGKGAKGGTAWWVIDTLLVHVTMLVLDIKNQKFKNYK